MTDLIKIQNEVNKQVGNVETFNALVTTTFKGLDVSLVKRAIMEGMMRGFEFKDFLQKNVYAIPFQKTYSLVTSIDYARKLGMRNGVVGVSEPNFEEKDGKVISCAITVKRKVNEYVGEYTAKVYFDEYSTGRNLWTTKPRTMIAKVAEMHALRKACPEEMSQVYIEEDMQKESVIELPVGVTDELKAQVENTKTVEELKIIWEAHKGLGKEFAKIVTAQKKFLNQVEKDEK